MNVTVFASHVHGDHYSKHILEWQGKIDGLDYVMGFPCEDMEDYILAGPRETLEHEGMRIATIESNDSGVGFLVEVDGVRIFHAGDHANRLRDFSGPYCAEIDYLAGNFGDIDLAFMPVSGCGFGDQEAVKMGVFYALEKLDPKYRAVLVLRLMDGYSTAETSEILCIPIGTVLSRLSRAQKKLNELLTPYYSEER